MAALFRLIKKSLFSRQSEADKKSEFVSQFICGEHFLDMEGVRGSIPLPPTREKANNQRDFLRPAKTSNGNSRQNTA
jgi:hypothetical protein